MNCTILYKGKEYTHEEFKSFLGVNLNTVLKESNVDPIIKYDTNNEPTFKDFSKLKDGTISKNKMKISKAKLLMPFRDLNLDISYEEFKEAVSKGLVDKRIFNNILSYRIPNQSISSNDSVEIVGILPPGTSDSAIVYGEIVTKTGSDFDVDKLYLMMPSFDISKKVILPEEIKNEIYNKYKVALPSLDTFREYKSTATRILVEMIKDDTLSQFLYDKGILNNGRIITERPLAFILENMNDLVNMSLNTNIEVDGVFLDDILVDYLDAIEAQKEETSGLINESKLSISEEKALRRKLNGLTVIESISYSDGNNYKGKQNKFIRLYNSILESEETYEDLITPLDADAVLGENYIKDSINRVLLIKYAKEQGFDYYKETVEKQEELQERYKEASSMLLFEMFSPIRRAIEKENMDKSKQLVAITANHMSDLSYTQLFNQSLNKSFIKLQNTYDNEELTSLAKIYTKVMFKGKEVQRDYLKQTMIVSWIMNAAVDAAKDNYIIEGNFNSYTAAAAMFMLRVGLSPEQVFSILISDPILDITASNTEGHALTSKIKNLRNRPADLLEDAIILNNFIKETNINFNELFKIENVFDNGKTIKVGNNTIGMSNALRGLWGMIHPIGRAMSNSLKLAKPDSNGSGSTIAQMYSRVNNLEVVYNENAFYGDLNKLAGIGESNRDVMYDQLSRYHINFPKNYTMIGASHNGLQMVFKLLGDTTLEGSKGFYNIVNDLSTVFGEKFSTKEDRLNVLINSTNNHILKVVHNPLEYLKITDNTEKGVKQARTLLYENIVKYKNALRFDNRFSFFSDLMIDELNESAYMASKLGISDSKVAKYKSELQYLMTNGNMFNIKGFTDVVKGSTIVNDLLNFSILTNGFRKGQYSLFDLLPSSIMITSGLGNKLDTIRKAIANGNYDVSVDIGNKIVELNLQDFIKTTVLNNPRDFRFVKSISSKQFKDFILPIKVDKTLKTNDVIKLGRDTDTLAFPSFILKDGKPSTVISFTRKIAKENVRYVGYINEISENVISYQIEELKDYNTFIRFSESTFNPFLNDLHNHKDFNSINSPYLKLVENLKYNELIEEPSVISSEVISIFDTIISEVKNDNLEMLREFLLEEYMSKDFTDFLGITYDNFKQLSEEEIINLIKCN